MSHPLHCILPPHMLEHIVENTSGETRERALRALLVDTDLRHARTVSQQLAALVATASTSAAHRNRQVYTARHGSDLPGTLVRAEGRPATGDTAVDEAYDGLGATFDLYHDVFGRNSIDDAGMDLIGTAHYGHGYDNAFFDGEQMVFGDGDGRIFNRFTIAIDVIGHELTHGVTAFEANLVYKGQSGALNESMSDVFGSLVKQYFHHPRQTAADADWLIGAGLFTPAVNGVALRSMKAPGTAYDDDVLGKDPQPADMAHYVDAPGDNGGVHINSGIPNRAFHLAAVALGGYAWEKAGRIWYETLCDPRLSSTAHFQDFASLSTEIAGRLFGPTEQEKVADAWREVGLTVTLGEQHLDAAGLPA